MEHLKTEIAGWSLLHYTEIDSTNLEARRLLHDAHRYQDLHRTIILADTQTGGRGRRGNVWLSGEGNLFASLILVETIPLAILSELSFVTALVMREAVARYLSDGGREVSVQCKWPNDILVEGKKVAGILLESTRVNQSTNEIPIIIGVGVNICSVPEEVEGQGVTALAVHKQEDVEGEGVRALFLKACLEIWQEKYALWKSEGIAAIIKEWKSHAFGIGKEVTVRLPKETFSGIFSGISEKGALQVEAEGKIREVSAGEVFF